MTQEENFNDKCKKQKKNKTEKLKHFHTTGEQKTVNQCTRRCPGRTSLTQSRMSKKLRVSFC